MNRTSLRSLAACVLFGGVVVAGCGGGDQTPDLSSLLSDGGSSSSGGSSGAGRDSGSFEYDSGGGYQYDSGGGGNEDTGTSSGSGGTCGSCTTDSECQSACPAVQGGGTNCCDVGSGVCYATTQTTCPTPSDGGAE
jgi:hypothetical protein